MRFILISLSILIFSLTQVASQCITTEYGIGVMGYTGDNGPATAASFNSMTDLAVDNLGNIFIIDAGNHVVRRIDITTGIITTIAGNGTSGFSGDGGLAINAQFNFPRVITFDAAGDLFIGDANNNRIRKVDAAGVVTTIVGPGDVNHTSGIVFNSAGEMIFVSSNQNLIKKRSSSGVITTIAGTGSFGSSGDGGLAINASFGLPQHIALDINENIYISDLVNQKIRKIDAATNIITTIVGTGTAGFSGDGGPAIFAELTLGQGSKIVFDADGNFLFADQFNSVLRKVDLVTGIISTIAGMGANPGYSGDNGLPTAAQLQFPAGFALDNTGDIFITDAGNNVVRKVSSICASKAIPTMSQWMLFIFGLIMTSLAVVYIKKQQFAV